MLLLGNAELGLQKVTTALLDMPGLKSISKEYTAAKPLAGVSILACVTPTSETGAFLTTLNSLGAKVASCSDNAFAADDDVVAYISGLGVKIFAKSNMSDDEYFQAMDSAIAVLEHDDIIHIADDGCDITRYIAEKRPDLIPKLKVITEQTTCGINFLRILFQENKLAAPAVNINHSRIKSWFDNYIGIQQSLAHSLTACGISLPGKVTTVFGYGPVGHGAAQVLQRLGGRVGIVEADIVKLMQAEFEGYYPVSAKMALQESDICLTATGYNGTITGDMIERYAKDGLMLGNIGHGTEEYDLAYLTSLGAPQTINKHIDCFTLRDGRKIYSLCKGALVNFLAGGGNMPIVMDVTFTLTVLAHLEAASLPRGETGLHNISQDVERRSAERSFSHLIPMLYTLTESQKAEIGLTASEPTDKGPTS